MTLDELTLVKMAELTGAGHPPGPETYAEARRLVQGQLDPQLSHNPSQAPSSTSRAWSISNVLAGRKLRVLTRHEARVLLGLSSAGFWGWLRDLVRL